MICSFSKYVITLILIIFFIPLSVSKINANSISTDPPIVNPQDVSGMFNERGFMKSNAVSFDDKEIINDFNGNLMYSIPLASGKDQGDLSYNISLNYNGNVNYQINTSDLNAANWNSGQLHQYNFTAPGWIISFNGFAIQMLNFENHFFTKASSNNYIPTTGRYVRMLANGYQYTDQFQFGAPGNPNKITIMLGDGSTETLENEFNGEKYDGDYKSTSKDSYVKAKVIFIDSLSIANYSKRRRLYYMKGDGLTYIFEEEQVSYKDLEYTNGISEKFRPLVFMLKKVQDRFGHTYSFDYQRLDGDPKSGRRLIKDCPGASFTFQSVWGTNYGFAVDTKDGRYLLYTETFGLASEAEHRPNLLKLLNPSGEYMNFGYSPYSRTGQHLYKQTSTTFDINFDFGTNNQPLYRLSSVSNFDGGLRTYTYFDEDEPLTIDYLVNPSERGAHSSMVYYKGQGRDLFFCNSLKTANVKLNGSVIRTDEFDYDYNINRSEASVWAKPVNENDEYISIRTTTSNLSTSVDNGTPQIKSNKKTYKNYPRFFILNETTDYDGVNKLIEDKNYLTDENTPYHKSNLEYDTGSKIPAYPDAPDSIYTGSFFETKKIETFGSVSAEWKSSYTFLDNTPPLLNTKSTIDPYGRIDSSTFTHFLPVNYHYRIFKDGTYVYYDYGNSQDYDSSYLFLANVPVIQVSKKNGTILSKSENIYSTDTSIANVNVTPINAKAYPGQITSTKVYNSDNLSLYLTTQYFYGNKDSTGKHLYNNDFLSSMEGAIRKIIGPKGDSTVYYYDIISYSEDKFNPTNPCVPIGNTEEYNCAPKFTYMQMNDSGTSTQIRSNWSDPRLPTRIDRFVNNGYYLSNYQLYDQGGNPTRIVDNNNYFSKIEYDKYYRLSHATLPYDFNNRETRDTVSFVDSTIVDVQLVSESQLWGNYNALTDTYFYNNNPINSYFTFSKTIKFGGTEDITEDVRALVKVNNTGFSNIDHIDSAFIEFSTHHALIDYNNSPLSDYNLRIIPLKVFEEDEGTNYEEGDGYADFDKFNILGSNSCDTDSSEIVRYNNNLRRLNITSLLNNNINSGSLEIQGFRFEMFDNTSYSEGELYMLLNFFDCNYNFSEEWRQKYLPKVKIYGRQKFVDTVKVVRYKNGTLAYTYDDLNNKVTVNSKIDGVGASNRYKVTEHFFDGLRRLTNSRAYYNNTSQLYDEIGITYNYMDQKSKTTDARNNSTKLRYDKYGNPDSTGNADNSYTLGKTTYINGLINTWDTIPGMVQKQEMTDEEGNNIEKYTDALGNLRREKRFVQLGGTETLDELITDYKYDALYRVVQVRTPNDRRIYYTYDGYGRQIQRETPDAGAVKYKYDKGGNLRFSQDDNQYHAITEVPPSKKITFRRYDGINRLLCIGETPGEAAIVPSWSSLDPDATSSFETYSSYPGYFLTINVYDTLISSIASGLFSAPGDYGVNNNPKGNLVATAYRTRNTDNWSFKYYRYDARGRVIRMWNVIDGLGTKITDYLYNSQNQVQIFTYQSGATGERKVSMYEYDDAGRLKDVYVPGGNEEPGIGDAPPSGSLNFARYKYNENSQIDTLLLNGNTVLTKYTFNNRNWVTDALNNISALSYHIDYLSNGNIERLGLTGNYNNNFSTSADLSMDYTYDKANRLLTSIPTNGYFGDSLLNTYDRDGNILTLHRKSNGDNFDYQYITNTNKLRRVSGSIDQYTYDYNGNMLTDGLNQVQDGVYDHRNLLTYISSFKQEPDGETMATFIYVTRYYYDEAGNRTRKIVFKRNTFGTFEGDPVWDDPEGDQPGWALVADEFYARDVSGKEIALYEGTALSFWNIYGSDNVGRINSDTTKQFYLKDHLGSTRAVVNSNNALIAAYDYDSWGYTLREWKSVDDAKYRFTGKERDNETSYDYFGARYYDSRIGRWGQMEPKYDKYLGFSSYLYSFNCPTMLRDKDGRDIIVLHSTNSKVHHMAILVGNDEKGWTYISKDGGGLVKDPSIYVKREFNSIKEFRNSYHNYELVKGDYHSKHGEENTDVKFKYDENGEVIQRYNEAYYISTDEKTDQNSITAAEESAKLGYIAQGYGLNCTDIVKQALYEAYTPDGKKVLDKDEGENWSDLPKYLFPTIKGKIKGDGYYGNLKPDKNLNN